MTVRECYEAMGGDYEDVSRRLVTEARIKKFALMFKKDPSMAQLKDAMESNGMGPQVEACYERVENALAQLEA